MYTVCLFFQKVVHVSCLRKDPKGRTARGDFTLPYICLLIDSYGCAAEPHQSSGSDDCC